MQWVDAARHLWRQNGVEGVYFDQITAMPPSLCYHKGHGHPLGGGAHYWRGYDEALGAMAGWIAEDPRRFLSSELMADAYLDRIDLYLAFVPPLEDYVPLFPAIYGGYTTVMGRATPGPVMADLQRFAMVQGEQFLFGGQLGRMNEDILKYPESAAMLRGLARLRASVREFVHAGTREAPLALGIEGKRVCLDVETSRCGKAHPVHIDREPVVHTVWRAPDGRVAVLLLNESREPASVRIPLAGDWRVLRLGVPAEEAETVHGGAIELPPLAAAACVSTPG